MAGLVDRVAETLVAAVRRAERLLGPEDDWVEDDRRILFQAAQRLLGDSYPWLTMRKGPADYVTTAHASPSVVETALHEAGYHRNLLSSRKYREHHDGGRQWAVGSWVLDEAETDWQHHVYLFQAANGATDVYAHRETSAREGVEHLTETQQHHGDPNGRVAAALDALGIRYGGRNFD